MSAPSSPSLTTTLSRPQVDKGELPDPFAGAGGERGATKLAWSERARTWRDLIVDLEYGGLPPSPKTVQIETLCHSGVYHWPGEPHLWTYRVHCLGGEQAISFCVRILFPRREEPMPALVNGNGCWGYVSEPLAQRVVQSGYALVLFNRTELAEEPGGSRGTGQAPPPRGPV